MIERQKKLEEGMAIRKAAELRNKRLRDAMIKKCDEMEVNNVPKIYINEVKRMIDNVK